MFVVGTAGHVDHGKSTLVRALTGIDPDRLREEQERAMTIDLGFAWLTLPSGREVSLVDVPGHERFIKNMLAGVGGLDAALLVIAADEGPMPQTTEHLAILDLLGIERGLIVLTKVDLVDDEWLALVSEEVAEAVRGTTLALAPTLPVSAMTGRGLPELLGALDELLAGAPRPSDVGRPRLPVDRVFTMAGFGTVVTGTLTGGALRVGDEVEVQPGARRARVRGLQSHRRKLEAASPGSRVAVNLSGVAVADLARGDVVTTPGWLRPTDRLDLHLRLLPSAARSLRQNDLVDLFTGAAEAAGRVTLLDVEELAPGSTGWVQVRLAVPVAASRGDRYIVRQPSPSVTIGGGVIVDPRPRRHRRFDPAAVAQLATLREGGPADRVEQALATGPLDLRALAERTGLGRDELVAVVAEMRASGRLLVIDPTPSATAQATDFLATPPGWQALLASLTAALAAYHRQFPLRPGMPREETRSRVGLPPRLFERVIGLAATEGALVEDEALLRLPTHAIAFSPAEQAAAERLLAALASPAVAPPSLTELAANPELVAALAHQGRLVRVSESAAFLADTYTAMVDWTLATIDATGSITVAAFRDQFSTSRKHALAVLEALDQRRITRRQGDARVRW
ncbi:MAG: selenocysteine-specific translation elongation factor [Chloroflexi bacterium]|nr:selenocysteine-specific translation elongation factor [Chloroflexota bacterium]